jgi:hypothetical protein
LSEVLPQLLSRSFVAHTDESPETPVLVEPLAKVARALETSADRLRAAT